MKNIKDLTNSEILTFLELARVALNDSEVSEYILSQCDISEDEAKELRETINEVMN